MFNLLATFMHVDGLIVEGYVNSEPTERVEIVNLRDSTTFKVGRKQFEYLVLFRDQDSDETAEVLVPSTILENSAVSFSIEKVREK